MNLGMSLTVDAGEGYLWEKGVRYDRPISLRFALQTVLHLLAGLAERSRQTQ
jgi:hypothetical protein